MSNVLVLYYSTYGHTERLAQAVAEGARSAGARVALKRVPELMPPDVALKAGVKPQLGIDIAAPEELPDYDAIIVGTPTRFGRVSSQMASFFDQTGGLWAQGALVGRRGDHAVFGADFADAPRHDHRGLALRLSGPREDG